MNEDLKLPVINRSRAQTYFNFYTFPDGGSYMAVSSDFTQICSN